MKNSILHVMKAFGACAVLGVSSLAAQSRNIVANVPFDFTVMNQHLPAGTYTVTSENPLGPILIRGRENGAAMFVLTVPTNSGKTRDNAKLVFDRFGSQYFLRNIWYAGTNDGQQLRVSKIERELAKNSQKPEQTTLVVVNRKPDKPR
jgi:hypothetical protein